MVTLTAVDVREHRLPNALTLTGAALILAGAAAAGRGLPALIGALALTSGYLLVHLLSPAAMGAGDVKLALGLGALAGAFGVDAWLCAALGAPMLTALWGLLSRRRVLPHGPAMCTATAVAVLLVISA
jgi:leader peptidase (prepilin peptidase) / N-methyltransferase